MIKVISALKRKPDMEVEAFQDYWLNVHGPIAARLPGVRRYVQSHTLLGGYRKRQPAADGIAELWFDDTDALRALEGTAALDATLGDHVEFVAPDGHLQIFTEEQRHQGRSDTRRRREEHRICETETGDGGGGLSALLARGAWTARRRDRTFETLCAKPYKTFGLS